MVVLYVANCLPPLLPSPPLHPPPSDCGPPPSPSPILYTTNDHSLLCIDCI